MKIRNLVPFVVLTILFLTNSCDGNSSASKNHIASPFDTTKFETQALTDSDRVLLANANGKTVKPIEIDALAEQINAASSKLYVYCFWNLKNDASVATVKALNTLTTKFDTTKLKIVYVNMPGYEKDVEWNPKIHASPIRHDFVKCAKMKVMVDKKEKVLVEL